MLKFVDLFAGIGGFRRGFEINGMKCELSCEINEIARKSYAAIHNEEYSNILEDVNDFEKIVSKLNNKKIDLICGGFPCQPFSRSGKREGFNDKTKGNLFFSTMRIVNELNPETVVLENVKGLLTIGEIIITEDGEPNIEVDKGSTFKDILNEFHLSGYDLEWQVINSAHYIEQKRERVYIHATKRKRVFKSIFPMPSTDVKIIELDNLDTTLDSLIEMFRNSNSIDNKPLLEQKEKASKYRLINSTLFTSNDIPYVYSNITPFKNWGLMINGQIVTAKINHRIGLNVNPLRNVLLSDEIIANKYLSSILTEEEVVKQKYSKKSKIWKSGNKMGNMAFPDDKNKPSRTLTANATGRELMIISCEVNGENKYRKLTDLECLRLQGFTDDDYIKMKNAGISNNQIKKQAGNAVTVNVINEIGKRLLKEV